MKTNRNPDSTPQPELFPQPKKELLNRLESFKQQLQNEPASDIPPAQAGGTDGDTDSEYDCNKTFASVTVAAAGLEYRTFDRCTFTSCAFTKTILNQTVFRDCLFTGCQFLLCLMNETVWDNVVFKDCKLMGMNFTECAGFSFSPSFENCLIDNSTFYDNNLKSRAITSCTVRNSDFTNCRLMQTDFSGTRFQNTVFAGCNMEKADFTSAENYLIDPAANKLKGARFSLPEARSFLKYLGIVLE